MPRRNRRSQAPLARRTKHHAESPITYYLITSTRDGADGPRFVTRDPQRAMQVSAARQAKGADVVITKQRGVMA